MFNQINNYGDAQTSTQLEVNTINWLNWSFASVGAFTNVTIPTSGAYGGNFHVLRPSRDPRYVAGRVWEGARADWMWESGVPYAYQPIAISGVYVNGAYQPSSGVGAYAHKVDYPNGRIVFTSPVGTGNQVTCEYSYRNVRVASADSPWFQTLQFESFRTDDGQFVQPVASGTWDVLAQNRIQLPAIVIEPVNRVRLVPYQLGNLGRWHYQDVLFHVYSETSWDRKQLHDILVNQWQNTFLTYDVNRVRSANRFPLHIDGSLASGAMTYPQLTNQSGSFYWKNVIIDQVSSENAVTDPPLYAATVRATMKLILP